VRVYLSKICALSRRAGKQVRRRGQKGLLHQGEQAVKGLLAILAILLPIKKASNSSHLFRRLFYII